MRAPGDRPVFPPRVVVAVNALACELPKRRGWPLSRYSTRDLADLVVEQGITASISGATVWRWLTRDAIRPWTFRSWIFPRDPEFAVKAGRVLDLYHGTWEGIPLGRDEFVLSADEKPSIQARARAHVSTPPRPGAAMRVEHEYGRAGALVYLAAWDVHRAVLFGRCEPRSGIAPFDALVAQVMEHPPYASARRVFWIVDNGSSHRGSAAAQRLATRWPNLILIHLPIHASWLNQIETFFSILPRKVLRPNAFDSLFELEDAILAFQERYHAQAKPFDWKYTRQDLAQLLARLTSDPLPLKIPA
ncbi:MAG: IS630 family transposase [Gemmatimonadaceae bacterium]